MAKRPTSGSKKARSKLTRVDPKRALAVAEFEKVRAWALAAMRDETKSHIAKRNAAIVLVLLGTAARRFELCAFRCGDFRQAFGGYRCYFESGKGNVEAEISISQDTWDVVQRWLDLKRAAGEPTTGIAPLFCGHKHEHLSVSQLHNIWVSVRKLVGIAARGVHVSVHMTRHTAGFLLLRSTKSLSEVAQFMRHKSEAVTERFYKHVLEEDVAAGLKKAGL